MPLLTLELARRPVSGLDLQGMSVGDRLRDLVLSCATRAAFRSGLTAALGENIFRGLRAHAYAHVHQPLLCGLSFPSCTDRQCQRLRAETRPDTEMLCICTLYRQTTPPTAQTCSTPVRAVDSRPWH